MSCLFYCICRHPGPEWSKPLLGVGGGPVYQVAHGGLGAAVSRLSRAALPPDLPQVKDYERVVLSYHRHHTVIPLRYGCVVEQDSQIIEHLEERGPHYEALLTDLEGCVEMGLRVLLPPGHWAAVTPGGPEGSREVAGNHTLAPTPAPDRLGLAYLTARKAHYVHQDRWTEAYRQVAGRCQAQFAGLYIRSKTEGPSPRLPLLSLYFLVRRSGVAAFRRAFQHLAKTESAWLLLSGPWPPYNFVTSGPHFI